MGLVTQCANQLRENKLGWIKRCSKWTQRHPDTLARDTFRIAHDLLRAHITKLLRCEANFYETKVPNNLTAFSIVGLRKRQNTSITLNEFTKTHFERSVCSLLDMENFSFDLKAEYCCRTVLRLFDKCRIGGKLFYAGECVTLIADQHEEKNCNWFAKIIGFF